MLRLYSCNQKPIKIFIIYDLCRKISKFLILNKV